MRVQLEEERRALAAFVSKFDSLGLGLLSAASSPVKVMPSPGGASATFAGRRQQQQQLTMQNTGDTSRDASPVRMSIDLVGRLGTQPSLLEQMPEEDWNVLGEVSFETEAGQDAAWGRAGKSLSGKAGSPNSPREIFGMSSKENLPA